MPDKKQEVNDHLYSAACTCPRCIARTAGHGRGRLGPPRFQVRLENGSWAPLVDCDPSGIETYWLRHTVVCPCKRCSGPKTHAAFLEIGPTATDRRLWLVCETCRSQQSREETR